MNKLLDFGRKAFFYARVLSGYEERRIRNYRLELEKRLQQILGVCVCVCVCVCVAVAVHSGVCCKFLHHWELFRVQAQEKKLALRKIPEQTILSEVRTMVEEMQALNKKLEETEAVIDDYFKPINMQAEILMKQQLDGEERTMTEMMKVMETKALIEEAQAEKHTTKVHHQLGDKQETQSPPTKQEAQVR
ncbi:hypothetical protein LINGRAHAP2_LOCUS7054 [Linum grandiflorum]